MKKSDKTAAAIPLPMSRVRLDAELAQIRADLLSMGFDTESMLQDVVTSLVGGGGSDPTADIIARDDRVDRLEEQIETSCLALFASPIDSVVSPEDARFILTFVRVATDVERIGDNAVNIARIVGRMRGSGVWYRPLIDIGRLGEMSRRMLHDALEAMVHSDIARAESVIAADDAVDALYARMRTELHDRMEAEPSVVRLGASLLFVIHYLERVSDHATSIAERLLFLETGRRFGTSAKPPSDGG